MTRATSACAATFVPRFWRMYFALWLLRRWRLPTTPCLSFPVAVILNRFAAAFLVFIFGIFISFSELSPVGGPWSVHEQRGMPFARTTRKRRLMTDQEQRIKGPDARFSRRLHRKSPEK